MPNWITYTWRVIVNLITLAVILAIFHSVSSGFETIVVSALVIIYLTIQTLFTISLRTSVQLALGLSEEFIRVRTLLNSNDSELPDDKERLEETVKTFSATTAKWYINLAFICLTYFITLFQLFSALNW